MQNSVYNTEELASTRNRDRLLPSQHYCNKFYVGLDFYGDLEKTLFSVLPDAPSWEIKTKKGVTYPALGSDINTLRFYQFLIRSHGYTKILELGTYIGISAIYFAEAVGEYGRVATVEKGEEFCDIAAKNIKESGVKAKIDQYQMCAVKFLKEYRDLYDFIFIDAAKESYKELLELSLPKLMRGGIILVDDVFFQCDTLNKEPQSEKGKGVKAMLDYVATLEDWEKVILPIGDGLLLMRESV